MTLFIVKIAPKQRSIHEKFLGIVGKISLIRENTCQSYSLSSDTKHCTVYHQTPSIAQSIIRHQASHSLSSDTKHRTVYHQTPSITQSLIRHQPAHTDNTQHTLIEFLKPSWFKTNDQYKISSHRTDRADWRPRTAVEETQYNGRS